MLQKAWTNLHRMTKTTHSVMRGGFLVTAALLFAAVVLLLHSQVTTYSSSIYALVRECLSTGAAVLLVTVIGSALIEERHPGRR